MRIPIASVLFARDSEKLFIQRQHGLQVLGRFRRHDPLVRISAAQMKVRIWPGIVPVDESHVVVRRVVPHHPFAALLLG